jgi:hypothetical protein
MDEIEDVIELGIEGIDTMIDKHWDKLPTGVFDHHNYSPRMLRKSSRRSSSMNPPNAEDTVMTKSKSKKKRRKETPQDRDEDRIGERGIVDPPDSDEGPSYIPYAPQPPTKYSNEPPRSRYIPQSYGFQGGYEPQGDYAPRSAPAMTRRGSSQPDLYRGRRRDQDQYSSDEVSPSPDRRIQRRRESNDFRGSNKLEKSREKEKRPSKHGVDLTVSSEGLIGAGVGAMIGGYASLKAQDYTSSGRKKPDDLLTLLGAAVGGLAVNAAIDRWEEGKKDRKRSRDRGRDRGY